jgi:hypothetical protein
MDLANRLVKSYDSLVILALVLESDAFVDPGHGKVRIYPDSVIMSHDGFIILVLAIDFLKVIINIYI